MFNLRYVLLGSFYTLCTLLCCHAQDVEKVNVRFVSFPRLDDPQPVELLLGESNTIPVDLPTNNISNEYTVIKPARWMLGKTVTDAEGKKTFKSYGDTPVLAAKEQLILAIRNGKTDEEGFKLIALDGGAQNFGGGKYFFFNASKVDIGCTLGESKFAIKPLTHTLQAPKPNDLLENNRKLLYVQLFFRRGDETPPFFTSQWRYNEKARTMVFIFHDGDTDRLRIHTIRDYVE